MPADASTNSTAVQVAHADERFNAAAKFGLRGGGAVLKAGDKHGFFGIKAHQRAYIVRRVAAERAHDAGAASGECQLGGLDGIDADPGADALFIDFEYRFPEGCVDFPDGFVFRREGPDVHEGEAGFQSALVGDDISLSVRGGREFERIVLRCFQQCADFLCILFCQFDSSFFGDYFNSVAIEDSSGHGASEHGIDKDAAGVFAEIGRVEGSVVFIVCTVFYLCHGVNVSCHDGFKGGYMGISEQQQFLIFFHAGRVYPAVLLQKPSFFVACQLVQKCEGIAYQQAGMK